MTTNDEMPPMVKTDQQLQSERIYRTALPSRSYIQLETECAQRTTQERKMTPYSMTRLVMGLYLQRKLVLTKDLPADIQQAINAHYAK